ncbi:hypothetical protein BH10PAT3_BH10PAT3_5240 [soil metagenome]
MSAAYATLSTSHLRHWARKKDSAAVKLYPLKARGSASYLTIEMLRALSLSGSIILLSVWAKPWLAWVISSVFLFLAFVVLTQLYLKPFGIRLLIWLSAPLLGLSNALKPLTLTLGRVFDRFIEDEPITLTRSELRRMLEAVQPADTDLTPDELRILDKVLSFSHLTVHDVMIPKTKVVSIKASETLSPVVLDELHKSGHGRFPVMADDGKRVLGILNMHELMDIKLHTNVAETMMQKVFYVEEDRDLDHVLQIFYKTRQSVFVVHNSASDMVGIISIEDVVQEILGKSNTKERNEPKEAEAGGEPVPVVE